MQATLIKRVANVKIYKIEFWCEITIVAIIIWENLDLCFGQKNTLGERRGSEFRRQIDNYNRVFKL